ncbi:hypothetical protein AN958_06263 [Leucoagaricus sp. SymC.cos]|nr:hypothetical protein AN958_06263 [Leucoagaricus sp. SymC.cos]
MNAADFGYSIGGPGPARKDKVWLLDFICIALLILVWRGKMSLRAMASDQGDEERDEE